MDTGRLFAFKSGQLDGSLPEGALVCACVLICQVCMCCTDVARHITCLNKIERLCTRESATNKRKGWVDGNTLAVARN